MEDFNSKYSGEEVDGLLDEIGNKVDKVEGKQLSTEDFTTALKNKLNGLSNYDDTAISQSVDKLRADLDALVSGDTTTAIKTFNEVIAFLDGISDTEDLSSIIASIEQQIAGKMDNVTLATVATSGDYNDLSNKPTIPSAVTENTVSGWGFTKNTGTYSKPSTGIPKTDLANEVQNSLEKADYSVQYTINGEAVIEYGAIVDGQSGVFYALPSADDDAKANADYIIATEEYVDSIAGGGGNSETIVAENSLAPAFQSTGQIKNNGVYILTSNILSLTINNLAFSAHTKDYEKFTMIFTTASSASFDGVSFPANWQWANGVAPNVEKGVTYELSVTYTKFGSSNVKYNAILTPFKAV